MYRLAFFLTVMSVMTVSGAQTERKTIWTGAYTAAQALRGEAEYTANCIRCHKGSEEAVNPESRLRGKQFMDRWREDNVESLFSLIKATMPRNDPGKLSDSTYIDIIAYLFQENEFPAGTEELTLAGAPGIQIEGKDGPMPLPHGALIQTVGCLTEGEDAWLLTRASEPARTRRPNEVTPQERDGAGVTELGRGYFRLQNIQFLGSDFRPLTNMGSKIHVKGFLVRQPNRERIDVTSIEVVSPDCGF